ncbi:protein kinase domain-containing protein [Corallococcus terminator]
MIEAPHTSTLGSAQADMRETTRGERGPRVNDSLISKQVNDFLVEERIGEGGMGVVYRAVHPLIGKQVAIKVLRAEYVSQQQVERLIIEARAVNSIRHPGIIDIFGFGRLPDSRPYIIMELLRGQSLSEALKQRGRLDPNTTVWILDQILSALGAAHKAGVVHRDMKPGNVFLAESLDGSSVVRLVDFGIAKLVRDHDGPTTVDGTILGTPEYMAPEQIRGTTVSSATDLYAVGIMAFQMLTGERPFKGEQVQVLFAHVEQPPPLPSSRVPGLPPEFDTLVLHLLAKDPAMRPESAEAVRQALQRIPKAEAAQLLPLQEPATSSTHLETVSGTTRSAIVPPAVRRRWFRAWPVAALLVTGVAGGAFLLGRGSTWVPERQAAPEQDRVVVPQTPPSIATVSSPLAPEATSSASRTDLPGQEQGELASGKLATTSLLNEDTRTETDAQPVAQKQKAPRKVTPSGLATTPLPNGDTRTEPDMKPVVKEPKTSQVILTRPEPSTQVPASKKASPSLPSAASPIPPKVNEAVRPLQVRLTAESFQAEQVLRAKVGAVANGSPALNELHAIRQRIGAALTVEDCDVLKQDLSHWKHSRLGPATGTSLREH